MYLALALAFAHVLALGPSFVGHPLTRALWIVVWLATAGTVLTYRVGLPLLRSSRHGLRVVEVRPEAPGVVSVVCSGRNLDRLPVAGGQFCFWRFLARDLWWQAHPYSLSAMPTRTRLRLTVKAVGDHSSAVARLTPGTRVVFEGPYGAFRAEAARRRHVVLLAAGIGVTSVRSLLEDLHPASKPVVVLRASQQEQVPLLGEIKELLEQRRGQLVELVGPRHTHQMTAATLGRVVPALSRREAYVCGPPGFVDATVAALADAGIPRASIHHEAYAL
jgi:ferredoxin-NADP reductase